MISWLVVIILAYLFFAFANLGDKMFLAGSPQPVSYVFYIGVLGLLAVVCIPFINFAIPPQRILLWIIAEAIVNILGLYVLYTALEKYDVSKVITTIGASQSIFIFGLTWLFWGTQPISLNSILAFILLVIGGLIISNEGSSKKTENYLIITLLSSFLFSLDYIFSKMVFLSYPFLQGFIWMKIFVFLFVMLFLFSKKARAEIFNKKNISSKEKREIFSFTQIFGGVATLMQAFAVSLVPVAFLPIANALRGIQYVFLFLMTLFLSYFFPKVLRESHAKKVVIQKIVSTILIVMGFWLLIM